MPRRSRKVFRSCSPEETAAVGRRLAAALGPGSVVTLAGPLGAGKTVFAKGLAAGLGIPQRDAVSPTFSLVNEHRGRLTLYHADLYRLAGEEEAREIGLEDYAAGDGVLVVEWPERARALLPRDAVRVEIAVTGPRTREITVGGAPLEPPRG